MIRLRMMPSIVPAVSSLALIGGRGLLREVAESSHSFPVSSVLGVKWHRRAQASRSDTVPMSFRYGG